MKKLLCNFLLGICCISSAYLVSNEKARAGEWGCQVILCLSNPGGATEYAQCRQPIQKLWQTLAAGHAFPTCTSIGFQSGRPGYEPYYCDTGFRLAQDYGPRGQEATCVTASPQKVSSTLCSHARGSYNGSSPGILSPKWRRIDGRLECVGYPTARPSVRSQPHYIDVTIDGASSHRVWY